ncbi:MAG TPA: AtzH-like domain-containing protein, partial [Microthrixaceae bacterium]|nr:AtzH-like domain-containing protein [Microthrixaceae bacterium]
MAIGPEEINRPEIVAEVTKRLEAYETALVANDVERLVDAFWVSPLAVRYGIDECQYGHDEIAEYRRASVTATPPRAVTRTVVTTFGDDFATA